MCDLLSEKIPQFSRLKIEHYAYMLMILILYVKILCNFVNFLMEVFLD